MAYDIVILTDPRYLSTNPNNVYVQNVLLEDKLIADALEKNGLNVTRKSWDDQGFDWKTTNCALFRATWDYFDRFEEFSKWLKRVSDQTNFINSKKLIDWNIDKHYMQDLESNGVKIPKTLFIEKETKTTLTATCCEFKTKFNSDAKSFVLKPCVSGAARHTYKIDADQISGLESIFQEMIASEAMMLQEFQQNIVTHGEISMMVFNGRFTHAVLKIAKDGDFRVQDDFGGTIHTYDPSQEEIGFAEKVVKAAPEMPLYARVDIFKNNQGNWALAELEIFEPELWFRLNPKAAEILAQHIKEQYFP